MRHTEIESIRGAIGAGFNFAHISFASKTRTLSMPSTQPNVENYVLPQMNKVGVIGLGYVGLPLLMSLAENGLDGLGFDLLQSRVDDLNNGKSYLRTISDDEIATHVRTGLFKATSEVERLAECDAVLICVPTPLNVNREPNLEYVVSATEMIAKYLREGQLIVLESTTYPGTTEELIKPILEGTGMKCGEDFYLAYSPEREDPGNAHYSTSTIPKVIGGSDPLSTKVASLLYQQFITQVISVSSSRVAEAVKLIENIYRAVNIGLVNELKMILEPMEINIWEVIDAAKTKPFGFNAFYPGPGWGGHCIPIDPFYLTWKAREFSKSSVFIEHAGDINNRMCEYVFEKTARAIDKVSGRGLRDAVVLVVGVAYKANIDDARESPSIPIIKKFQQQCKNVEYYDPHIPHLKDHELEPMDSVEFSKEMFEKFDVIVICTHHDEINWETLVEWSPVVVDTRNATKSVINNRERIFYA